MLFKHPSKKFVSKDDLAVRSDQSLKTHSVHNVFSSIFDYLMGRKTQRTLYVFKGRSTGMMRTKYAALTLEFIYNYGNQGECDMI
ncbi:Pyrophosphate--fructose 6-phosphate 1-phosphotransferase subunit BETA [Nymphaea thermarum]|nr:Pyrophosphate--fructose 6-phosphate 1-phosphotransferase subunit BETA [Nymphaea thermarum]